MKVTFFDSCVTSILLTESDDARKRGLELEMRSLVVYEVEQDKRAARAMMQTLRNPSWL